MDFLIKEKYNKSVQFIETKKSFHTTRYHTKIEGR
jgi:hypothetical protein